MAPLPKLSNADVREIRRRVRRGARQTDLAREYGVNRKTIQRRLAELEEAEKAHAERLAAKRLRWQARRERQKLHDREQSGQQEVSNRQADADARASKPSLKQSRSREPYLVWLDRRKNLTGRALAEASGLLRIESADGSRRVWVERSEIEALLDEGWRLAG